MLFRSKNMRTAAEQAQIMTTSYMLAYIEKYQRIPDAALKAQLMHTALAYQEAIRQVPISEVQQLQAELAWLQLTEGDQEHQDYIKRRLQKVELSLQSSSSSSSLYPISASGQPISTVPPTPPPPPPPPPETSQLLRQAEVIQQPVSLSWGLLQLIRRELVQAVKT